MYIKYFSDGTQNKSGKVWGNSFAMSLGLDRERPFLLLSDHYYIIMINPTIRLDLTSKICIEGLVIGFSQCSLEIILNFSPGPLVVSFCPVGQAFHSMCSR